MERVKTAVILAGGAGLRLRPLSNDKPKVMIELLGKPILQWVVEWLEFNNISNLVIGVAYKKESIMDYSALSWRGAHFLQEPASHTV